MMLKKYSKCAVVMCLCAVVLMFSTIAAAQDSEKEASPAPDTKSGGLVGSLEFNLGFGDGFTYKIDGLPNSNVDASPTLGITPSLEKKLGSLVGLGAELMFLWAGAENIDSRSLVTSLHLRLRMSFPVYKGFTFDGILGAGPSVWFEDSDQDSSNTNNNRFGLSVRFAFGAGYAFNDAVAASINLGYYFSNTWGDDVSASLDSVLLSVGLRANF